VRERSPRVGRQTSDRSSLAEPALQVGRLRSALGEEAFALVWAQGRAMTVGDSLAYALEQDALKE